MALVISGFQRSKEFLRKLSAVWVRALKMVDSPVPGREMLKNICVKGHHIALVNKDFGP
jgi:hypothetical protein